MLLLLLHILLQLSRVLLVELLLQIVLFQYRQVRVSRRQTALCVRGLVEGGRGVVVSS